MNIFPLNLKYFQKAFKITYFQKTLMVFITLHYSGLLELNFGIKTELLLNFLELLYYFKAILKLF